MIEPHLGPERPIALSPKEAKLLAEMTEAIQTMPREEMSALQKQFARLADHTLLMQYKMVNLANHASNQEKRADDLQKLVNQIKDSFDFDEVDGLIKEHEEAKK